MKHSRFLKLIFAAAAIALSNVGCSAPSSPDQTSLLFTQITPSAGSVTGNEWITLTADHISQVSGVKIGAYPCTSLTVLSDNQIQCKTPAIYTGAAKVDVTLTANASRIVLPKAFSWQVYLGQPDGYSGIQGSLGLNGPLQFKQCGTHYVVTDALDKRVLIYNQFPTSMQVAPDLVLGQPSPAYIGVQANLNEDYVSSVNARRFSEPYGVACDSNRLIVSDAMLHRIFIWSSFPYANNQGADLVLGQSNFSSVTANAGGISGSSVNDPAGVWLEGEKIIVADYGNHRVLIWNTFPTVNGQTADFVVGQPTMATNTMNNGGVSEATLKSPLGVGVANGKLMIADYGNNRVLIYANVPSINHASANHVLGQTNFTDVTCNMGGRTSATLCGPSGIASDGVRVAVGDKNNFRVSIWSVFPTFDGQPASSVLGQTTPLVALTDGGGLSVNSIADPYLISYFSGKIAVSDYTNHRVMMWNLSSLTTHAPADFIFGQVDSTTGVANGIAVTDKTFQTPVTPSTDGVRLVVGDYRRSRILIWNTIPKLSNTSPDLVLGQADFTQGLANQSTDPTPSPSASTLNFPAGVMTAANKVIVGDQKNNRVMIWNTFPTLNNQTASRVLGQVDFVSNVANRGGTPSAATLNNPYGVWTNGIKVIVCDYGNNRVLIWNTFPASDGAAADIVLGQPDVATVTANTGGVSATSMSGPIAAWVVGTKLLVSDNLNHRVLVWNTFPTTTGQAADLVIGQPFFTTNSANMGGLAGWTLNAPRDISSDGTNLIIADEGNHRLLVWKQFPTVNFQAADRVVGQRGFLVTDYRVEPGRYPMVNGLFSNLGLWFTASRAPSSYRVTIGPAE